MAGDIFKGSFATGPGPDTVTELEETRRQLCDPQKKNMDT